MAVTLNNIAGIVCGQRTNGMRCILWDDESIGDGGFEWFKAEAFSATFGE